MYKKILTLTERIKKHYKDIPAVNYNEIRVYISETIAKNISSTNINEFKQLVDFKSPLFNKQSSALLIADFLSKVEKIEKGKHYEANDQFTTSIDKKLTLAKQWIWAMVVCELIYQNWGRDEAKTYYENIRLNSIIERNSSQKKVTFYYQIVPDPEEEDNLPMTTEEWATIDKRMQAYEETLLNNVSSNNLNSDYVKIIKGNLESRGRDNKTLSAQF